jgi:hypothetical protein
MRDALDTLRRLAALTGLACLGGCAHVWVDDQGNRHVVGLLHLTQPPAPTPAAAETLRVRTLGLTWTRAEAGSALVLGYGDTTLGFLRNDVCVAPDRAHPETRR